MRKALIALNWLMLFLALAFAFWALRIVPLLGKAGVVHLANNGVIDMDGLEKYRASGGIGIAPLVQGSAWQLALISSVCLGFLAVVNLAGLHGALRQPSKTKRSEPDELTPSGRGDVGP